MSFYIYLLLYLAREMQLKRLKPKAIYDLKPSFCFW